MKIQVVLTFTVAAAVLRCQVPNAHSQEAQQAQLAQLLMQLQQTGGAAPAGLGTAQPGPSTDQMRQIIQALNKNGNQDPAVAAQLLKILSAGQAGSGAAVLPQETQSPAFLVRQDSQQIPLTPRVREGAFVKTKSNDVADALKAQAMSQAINLGATAAARKVAGSVPYFGSMTSVVGRLPFGGNGKQQGWEFDFLRGISAEVGLKSAGIEFVVPASRMIADPAGVTFEPLLVRLKQVEKDKVRIIAARKVVLSPKAPSAFGATAQEPFEREMLSSEYESIPIEVRKNADGTSIVKVTRNLEPGEYALVFQKPEPKSFRLVETVLDFKVAN